MKITSFEDIEIAGYEVCFIHSGCDGEADVIILDINSIFDYEEKKHEACKDKFTSVAVIDDITDYDAFKNFGITAWIKRDDISKMPELIKEIENRMAA